MFQVSCGMRERYSWLEMKFGQWHILARVFFLRREGGACTNFWQEFWWIRLNQEYRFLRRGDKEWEERKPKSQNVIDWGREDKTNKPSMYRGQGGEGRQGEHGRKIEELVNNWSSNKRWGHCTNSKRRNLGVTESGAGAQCGLELSQEFSAWP